MAGDHRASDVNDYWSECGEDYFHYVYFHTETCNGLMHSVLCTQPSHHDQMTTLEVCTESCPVYRGANMKKEPTELTINGVKYEVPSDLPPLTSLNTFIRDHAHLKGTKFMCLEGGCGSCVVTVKSRHPYKMEDETYAVNSCLMPVFSCHGWEITTVEGIGDKKIGYHPVQKRLAEMNGTQCGYCSPGMVMNMYSLLEGKTQVTMKDVENSFGGNICRCTGYRPILDAFKSLTVDATPDLKQKVLDIEELCKIKICPKNGKQCNGRCDTISNGLPPSVRLNEAEWYNPTSLPELFDVFSKIGDNSYMLVGGNTGHGVYRVIPPLVYINIGNVPELKVVSMEPTLTLGGNISLTEAMELFYKLSKEDPNYAYLKALADHIDLIANVPVRNTGTIAGNLALKNKHREFPSDVFLILETVGATLSIEESGDKVTKLSMTAFLDMDMTHKVIQSISLPKLDASYFVRTFKIMPRAQNAHAYVNAGFMFKMNKNENGKILAKPSIVYGGITPELVHASNTESYLNGKNLFDRKVLRTALKMLDTELHPDHVLPDATPAYRKGLAEALLYKFVLGLSPPGVEETLLSGGKDLERPVSSGKQDFDTDKSEWPLNKPIPKLEAIAQCSGEAQYVNDIPAIHGELFAAFVITTVGQGYVSSADTSEALSIPGVIAYLDVKDIPGKNSFIKPTLAGLEEEEEIFCSGNIKYAGQPVGIIVAETQQIAVAAAQKVKLEYMGIKKAITHIRDALTSGDQARVRVEHEPKQVNIPGDAAHTIKGSLNFGSQYHYTMETQTTVCVPVEDGMDVFPASQWMDLTQITIAEALNVPENSINVKIKRIGGGYGAKISRASLVSAACAVAAHKLNTPVRMILPLETNTAALGKRSSVAVDYEVYVDENGKIKCLNLDMAEDAGCSWNEPVTPVTIHHMTSCYDDSNWAVTGKAVHTDTPSMTYCRAPGSTEGVATIEFVMEHIAKVVKKDPIEVRINNMSVMDNPIPQMIKDLKAEAAYDARKDDVIEFNKKNRWRKRGIALVAMKYPFPFWGNYSALVSIYSQDGTVAVTHGGIECGQGIHTKVAQVVAYTLGIPLELVSVKASNTLTTPNGMVTGGSITSEVCAYAAMMCCKQLLERMEPVKKSLKNPTWQEWVYAAYKNDVDLCATYMYSKHDGLQEYGIYGATIAEVEVDLLTGRHLVLRVDIVEDAGKSMSPEIDIGQVEGAFIMGMGYWFMEYLVYSPETGELLTNRTWNYKPPGVKDIPIDFRVQLRKNAPNPFGVLRSKATGEPPFCMSCVLPIAVRNALDSARKDAGKPDEWYQMDAPATTENIFLTSLTNIDQFVL